MLGFGVATAKQSFWLLQYCCFILLHKVGEVPGSFSGFFSLLVFFFHFFHFFRFFLIKMMGVWLIHSFVRSFVCFNGWMNVCKIYELWMAMTVKRVCCSVYFKYYVECWMKSKYLSCCSTVVVLMLCLPACCLNSGCIYSNLPNL